MKKLLIVACSIILSGCFISNPYKSFSTGKPQISNSCHLSGSYKDNNESYSCLFIESEEVSSFVSRYFFVTKVNDLDFNKELNGSHLVPRGLQSIALPSNTPSNLTFAVAGVRDGFGFSTNNNIRINNFTPEAGKTYIARMEFITHYKFKTWIEESDSGKVVAGKRE